MGRGDRPQRGGGILRFLLAFHETVSRRHHLWAIQWLQPQRLVIACFYAFLKLTFCAGLWQFLEKRKCAETLDELRNSDGDINCVFIACDLPYQYLDGYFEKLDESHFPPIHNRHLTEVDHYNNYDDLEHDVGSVMGEFYDGIDCKEQSYEKLRLRKGFTVLDVRHPDEFSQAHLPDAINLPIKSYTNSSSSPWRDSHVMAAQWKELESLFGGGSLEKASPLAHILCQNSKVLLVCRNGDTARIAASILGAKGARTENLRGGMEGLEKWAQARGKLPHVVPAEG